MLVLHGGGVIAVKVSYLTVLESRWWMVQHVECYPSSLVNFLHPCVYSLELRLEQRKHVLCNKPMHAHRCQICIVERQRVFSPHFESATFDSEICSVRLSAFFRELDITKVELRGFFFDGNLSEWRMHYAVDVFVRGWLVCGETVQEGVQMGGVKVSKLVAQNERSLLRLVKTGQRWNVAEVSGYHLEQSEY